MSLCRRKLDGKVAIVTGSSSGIGAAIAIVFAKEGANVSLAGRNKNELEKIAKECEKFGAQTVATVGDISKIETREAIVKNTIQKFKKLDILVNNAGVFKATPANEWANLETYDFIMDINLKAVYHLTALCIPFLAETKGNVINISSVAGRMNAGDIAVYCMSKAALDMFTKAAAMDLGKYHIRVNSVSPGLIQTNIFRPSSDKEVADPERMAKTLETLTNMHVIKRAGNPEEIANPVLFLASDEASFMTGSNVVVDGGVLVERPAGFSAGE